MNSEQLIAGRYRIIEQVGTGGMAIVYRAEDINTGRSVAIKILKPEYTEDEEFVMRFTREADAISQMTHHNIVNLLDVGNDDGAQYLVMEYVQGKTLKEVIKEMGKMSPEVAAQIAIRILAALKHAHQNGVIHRDIKPQNILVHDDGHIKVADFGIATKIDSETLAKTDNVMGSVHYISPEQASGKELGPTSDLYSVGVVMYEMLTGRVPFDGDTVVAVAMQHLRGIPMPIQELVPGINKGLVQVVSKAMDKDPKRRYQSALEMAADIRAAMQGEPIKGAEKKDTIEKQNSDRITPVNKGVKRRRLSSRMRRAIKYAGVILMTAIVFLALALGGVAIYNNVINSATAPDLVGMDVDTAIRTAQREGINTEVIHAHHQSIATGHVIMQAPQYDEPMRKGDTIVLTVSKGPNTFAVPNITGILSTEAVTLLQKANVVMVVTERTVSQEPVDTILTQNPAAGDVCAAGDTVQVTVSGGAVTVPDTKGQHFEQAAELLTAAGLSVAKESIITTDIALLGQVASQKPAAETQVALQTLVTLTVYDEVHYQGMLKVNLPEAAEGLQVKIVHISDEGAEEEQYSAMHAAVTAETIEVEVYGTEKGQNNFAVYINGKLFDTLTAELK